MRMNWVPSLAVAALVLALGACGSEAGGDGDAAKQGQTAADAVATPAAASQAPLEAAFLGKSTPPYPEGFVEEGGHLDGDSVGIGAIWIVYGRWTHPGGEQPVMFVQRTTGAEPANARGHLPAEIVSVYAMPARRAGEIIFTEYCTHPDYPETAARIYANAGTAQQRPGLSDPPSAAWRLDRDTARLLPVDAANVTCGFDHME